MICWIPLLQQYGQELTIKLSQFVSLFIDESTDTTVHKKLAIYGHVLDPETFNPSAYFVIKVRLENGTCKALEEDRH